MFQFFVKSENIQDDEVKIVDREDISHITNSLRFKIGDKFLAVDEKNKLVYTVKILNLDKTAITCKIIDKTPATTILNTQITLAQSILKSAKQDIAVQKATELGACEIIPLITKNTVVKIEDEKDKINKLRRWKKISIEASKQCKRASLCKIDRILSLKELLNLKNDFDEFFVCSERDTTSTLKQYLKENGHALKILVIIGPEGGFDDKEIEFFNQNNIPLLSLGNLILRAETASITAISNIVYEYEL